MSNTELAKKLRHGMFADRDTVNEALEYAYRIAKGCAGHELFVVTAIHVLANTIANEIDRNNRMVKGEVK
jgi:hypothetical protein